MTAKIGFENIPDLQIAAVQFIFEPVLIYFNDRLVDLLHFHEHVFADTKLIS